MQELPFRLDYYMLSETPQSIFTQGYKICNPSRPTLLPLNPRSDVYTSTGMYCEIVGQPQFPVRSRIFQSQGTRREKPSREMSSLPVCPNDPTVVFHVKVIEDWKTEVYHRG